MNTWCQILGIEPPRVEAVARHREASAYALLIVSLLERGAPMTLPEVAARLAQAGVATAERALQALQRCRPARPPVYRSGAEYALDPHDHAADLWAFRLGLRPPRVRPVPIVRPAPEPVRGPEEPLTVAELDEAWKDASLFGAWSAQRIAVAVLDAHGRPMAPGEVVAFVEARTPWHGLRGGAAQFGRRGSAVQVDAAGRWACVPGHSAIRGARTQARARLAMVRRWAAQRGAPAQWEANRQAFARRRAAHGAELASLRRLLVHAWPPGAPRLVVVLDVNEHRIETLDAAEPQLRARLQGTDVIAGLEVRSVLRSLGHDAGAQRLQDLGPPQKTRRLNSRGRVLHITPALLVSGSCAIPRPLADPQVLRRYERQGQHTRLRRRLEADAKSLYALYEFGRLHGRVRLRWGFVDEWLAAPWVDADETLLDDLAGAALECGLVLEVVAGSAPGWSDPWARVRRCTVRGGAYPSRWWILDEDGEVVEEAEVQSARLVIPDRT